MVVDIEPILKRVIKPARYTGGEWNTIVKDWDSVEVRLALCFPDLYEIGMSKSGELKGLKETEEGRAVLKV